MRISSEVNGTSMTRLRPMRWGRRAIGPPPATIGLGSHPAYVDDGLREGLRRLLGQVVADAAGNDPVLILAGKHLCISTGVRMRRPIGIALQRYRRHADDWRLCKPLFEIVILRLAFG